MGESAINLIIAFQLWVTGGIVRLTCKKLPIYLYG